MNARIPAALFALPLVALLSAAAGHVGAATVPDLLRTVGETVKEENDEPGNAARAKAIVGLFKEELGLSKGELLDLRLALAGAWLDAGKLAESRSELAIVLAAKEASPGQRENAGLTQVAVWQAEWKLAEKPAEMPSALVALAPLGDLGKRVAARAHSAEAQRLLAVKQPDGVLAHYDQALDLLKDQPAAERVPLYALRLLAMEELGQKPDEVQAWLQGRIADPAAAQVLASALTAGEKLVGQPAPALKMKRVDGVDGEIDLAAYKGKPVLIDFFATWCKPCASVAPIVAAVAKKLAEKGVVTIGITLDTKDSLPNLAGWIAKNGIAYPVIGDGLGWDSEVDDAWHVDGIPALILVAADGTIAANDLMGATAEETVRNIEAALEGAQHPRAPGAAHPGGGVKPA
ncbi:MAG: TlpA family protein disulfide reductase, partial [Planctomycetes bacterium]|nr:TlpA family protein disulfide reductase [Planctomycetota bacterium]